ncbi:MAG TPA: FAD-dependent monooxygenase [Anaerolineae bacterium]|nr:FAD-dependent monooxygenase [Anaerolineae bacterium]
MAILEQTMSQPTAEVPAVVIGASMAGLLAARVLANHYRQVILIERDDLPDAPSPRNGVPQARHAHLLLIRGRQILDQLFPGLVDALIAEGAFALDIGMDFQAFLAAGWTPRIATGLVTISCSRDLLETRLRQRLATLPTIQFLEKSDAIGLVIDKEQNRVTHVRVRSREASHDLRELPAQLIVDASGRSSHSSEWLTALGYPVPPETTVNAFLGYASRIYAAPTPPLSNWKALVVQARAPSPGRGGVILPLEGNRWIVTLAGYGRNYPPTHEEGFLEFASSLPVPDLYEAIRHAEPLSPISGYQRTENHWRHFEQLANLPENLFFIGDSVCAFNPVYGQGMTNAAMSALTLDQALRTKDGGSSYPFQKQLAKQNETPWLLATTEDYRYPTTQGPKLGLSTRLAHWYLKQLIETLTDEPEVFLTFLEVLHLVRPPSVLGSAPIVAKVMRHSLFHRTPAHAPVAAAAGGDS